MDNKDNLSEPLFYTGYDETAQLPPEENQPADDNPFYQDYNEEYVPPAPEKNIGYQDDVPQATAAEKAVFITDIALGIGLVLLSNMCYNYRNEKLYHGLDYMLFNSLLSVAIIVLLFFISAYVYGKSLRKKDKVMIKVIKRRAPFLKQSLPLVPILLAAYAAEIYILLQQDKIVIWILAALLAAAAALVVFGFPLLIREKVGVILVACLVFNTCMTFRLVPVENYSVRYMYVSADGYEGVSGQSDEYFFEGAMSEKDFLASVAYVNEKQYIVTDDENEEDNDKYKFSDRETKKGFLAFFTNPGYSVRKDKDSMTGSEKRFMTLVFPLKDKNDRVYVDSLALSLCWSYSSYKVKTQDHKNEYPISLYRDNYEFTMDDYYSAIHDNDIKAYCIIAVDSQWDKRQDERIKKLLVLDNDNEGKDFMYVNNESFSYLSEDNKVVEVAGKGQRTVYSKDCYCEYHISYI